MSVTKLSQSIWIWSSGFKRRKYISTDQLSVSTPHNFNPRNTESISITRLQISVVASWKSRLGKIQLVALDSRTTPTERLKPHGKRFPTIWNREKYKQHHCLRCIFLHICEIWVIMDQILKQLLKLQKVLFVSIECRHSEWFQFEFWC